MLGRFLFRWRGVIGVAAFGAVFLLARPTFASCLLGLPLLLVGLAVRFWASGYLGIEGRVREIGARRRIVSGPYRLLRHPLYIGNFLLVAGMLFAMRPAPWLGAAVMVGFVIEYVLIVVAEEKDLADRRVQSSESRVQNPELPRAGGERRMASGEQAGRRSQKSDVRCEMPEVQGGEERGAKGERRMASGGQFGVRRALCEWRTWVATGVGFGLALLKAAFVS